MLIYLSNRSSLNILTGTSVWGEASRWQWQEREKEAPLVGREHPMLPIPLLRGSVMGKSFLPFRL